MAIYSYKAFDSSGKTIEDQVEGINENDIIRKLKSLNLSPLSITLEKKDGLADQSLKKKKITRRDINNITNQLASLLNARLPLAKALKALENQSTNLEMKNLIKDIYSMVSEGKTFSEALEAYPNYFSSLYRSMVKAGEIGGVLEKSLSRVSEMLEKDEELRSKLKGALTYPAIMVLVMILSILVLLTFVVPRFTGMFADMGAALPLPTTILINTSNFFQAWWWLMAIAAGSAIAGIKQYTRSDEGRLQFDKLRLNLPFAGALVKEVSISRLSLTMGSLLESGVNILQAMDAARDVVGNEYIGLTIDKIKREVKEGRTLSSAMSDHQSLFPSLVIGMVGTGEETGNLDEMLSNVGRYYMQEADVKIKALTTLLEPVIILVMGVVVGFIIIAMLLPIFEMTTMVK